jgi:hypothetical protein
MKQKDRQNRSSKTVSQRKIKRLIVIGLIIVAISIGISLAVTSYKLLPSSNGALSVDGIQCNTSEQLLFHIHAHLDVFVNGQLMYIPPQIGIIPDKCIYWLHTHDETGIIHIESPVKRDFTLGQFFDLWKRKINNPEAFNNIFNETGSNNNNIPQIYISGNKLPTGTNYRDVKLHAHDEIALIYGTPPANIPSKYDFPQGL